MQKIMFNNHYGLEDAVLAGTKTRTSRIVDANHKCEDIREFDSIVDLQYGFYGLDNGKWICLPPKYKMGERIAIAQSYGKICFDSHIRPNNNFPQTEQLHKTAGWNNKMFVKAENMPHEIIIYNIEQQRLQDISNEDCLKEGITDVCVGCEYFQYGYYDSSANGFMSLYDSPRKAFASLIDKISGKGTWNENPWIWVYYFELVK